MDLLTLRAAAGGGSVDGHAGASLVAAGFTLLQRSPVLVRALAAKRAAILIPGAAARMVALAASDGRGALLADPHAAPAALAARFAEARVGAVFTTAALASRVPAGLVQVRLDDAPVSATVVAADGSTTRVDLGSHFGLDLEGDAEAAGRDEECLLEHRATADGGTELRVHTHRALITAARWALQRIGLSPEDRVLPLVSDAEALPFAIGVVAPLLGGARVSGIDARDDRAATDRIAAGEVTVLLGTGQRLAAVLDALEASGAARTTALRRCVLLGDTAAPDSALSARWLAATGVRLHRGRTLPDGTFVLDPE